MTKKKSTEAAWMAGVTGRLDYGQGYELGRGRALVRWDTLGHTGDTHTHDPGSARVRTGAPNLAKTYADGHPCGCRR